MKLHEELERLTNKIRTSQMSEEEPVFVLRAQDILAAHIVEYWADMVEDLNGPGCPKVAEAHRLAIQMRKWARRKVPGRNWDGELK
jgi:hypothetical protein